MIPAVEPIAQSRLGGLVAAAREKGRNEKSSPKPPSVVLIGRVDSGNYARSRNDPESIYVEMDGRMIIRAGVACVAPRHVRRILLALFGAQGRPLTDDDLTDALYLDREDGGADFARTMVTTSMVSCRDVGAALGFRIEAQAGIGYRLYDTRGTA